MAVKTMSDLARAPAWDRFATRVFFRSARMRPVYLPGTPNTCTCFMAVDIFKERYIYMCVTASFAGLQSSLNRADS